MRKHLAPSARSRRPYTRLLYFISASVVGVHRYRYARDPINNTMTPRHTPKAVRARRSTLNSHRTGGPSNLSPQSNGDHEGGHTFELPVARSPAGAVCPRGFEAATGTADVSLGTADVSLCPTVGSRPPPDTLSLSRLSRKFRQDAAVTDPTESETCVRWHRETSAVPCVAECGERAA